jgi:hypothetical protein
MPYLIGQHQQSAFGTPVRGGALDATVVRDNDNAIVTTYNAHDIDPTVHVQSDTTLPSVGQAGRIFWATGTHRLSYDTGTVWADLTLDAGDLTSGTVPTARLAGSYSGITAVGTLASLTVTSIAGATTFDTAPTLSSLTASQAVFTNASKQLVSTALTGSGNVVMSNSPTLTGLALAASASFSGTLSVDGTLTAVGTMQANAVTVTTSVSAASMSTTGAIAAGGALSGTSITGTGLLNISAAGAGQIQFPATQNASANANTLDDYREGTFTPSGLGVTFSSASGTFTRIGNVVTFRLFVTIPSTASSNPARIAGLPFSAGGASVFAVWTDHGTAVQASANASNTVFLYNLSGAEYTYANLSTKTVQLGGSYIV